LVTAFFITTFPLPQDNQEDQYTHGEPCPIQREAYVSRSRPKAATPTPTRRALTKSSPVFLTSSSFFSKDRVCYPTFCLTSGNVTKLQPIEAEIALQAVERKAQTESKMNKRTLNNKNLS
jgi:hypothetical protein